SKGLAWSLAGPAFWPLSWAPPWALRRMCGPIARWPRPSCRESSSGWRLLASTAPASTWRGENDVAGLERFADYESDIKGRWSEDALRNAVLWGVLRGDDKGRLRPRDPVTREELAAVVHRLMLSE